MNRTNKKWVNPNLNRTLLTEKRFKKIILKNKVNAIYDLRLLEHPVKKTIDSYLVIDPVLVKNYISLHSNKEVIVLVSELERTYVPVLTHFRLQGYKKIFIYSANKDNLEWIIKK